MHTAQPYTVLIISSAPMVTGAEDILGNGGWLPPEEREALDWLTLIKFMGWKGQLISPDKLTAPLLMSRHLKYIIIADNPDTLDNYGVELIFKKIESEPTLLIARAGKKEGLFALLTGMSCSEEIVSGEKIKWTGPGESRIWQGRKEMALPKLNSEEDSKPLAVLEGNVLIASKQIGQGKIAALSFHPSEARDHEGIFSALLKHLLIWGGDFPVFWFDWSNTVVLRMDDPGSAQIVHHKKYNNHKLGKEEWAAIGQILKKHDARLSIGYVSGWVDDGDSERGRLTVGGSSPAREAGKIHPSPKVRYEATGRNVTTLYDYETEFSSIQLLRKAGLAEVEFHGYTHIHPDKKNWSVAADRYTSSAWYREFSRSATEFLKSLPDKEHPLNVGLRSFSDIFQTFPTTLICPGDEFTNEVLEKALRSGLKMVSSYYQCIRIDHRFCWAQHVCAPYLDKSDSIWFDSELPVVGYFHDFDLAIHTVDWLSKCLLAWEKSGAKHFIDLGEMAGRLSSNLLMEYTDNCIQIELEPDSNATLTRPVKIWVRVPDEKIPSHLTFLNNGETQVLPLENRTGGIGQATIPIHTSPHFQNQSTFTTPSPTLQL